MPNSVDTNWLRPGPRHNALRQELGLGDCFVVSFAGVMGHSQDLDVVLDAANVLRDHDDIHFLLVGDGVEKECLVRKGEELGLRHVTWLPMQPRDRYPAVLQASDVGLVTLRSAVKTPVVPSKIPSLMAAGRPVVTALDLQGDAPRLIADAQAGLCLEPEQPQALADAILSLYRD
ncbi:MAG: glycosyltransferase family 4 protein, partial [Chloroflexi bacterium]|nr:glycosyltransferase family 4 protein [Chloroflexota bacterium]